jgi:DNA/RNA-binding domain of Phe-tRNA-synthetase-like protein
MTKLRVQREIFATFPDAILGIVTFDGVRNEGDNAEIAETLRKEQVDVVQRLGSTPVSEHPHIACWREAYRRFGAKPKDHPSSIENLVRRVTKGQSLRHVNRLVDLYNAISLKHLVPAGGEDLEAIDGDVELAFAGDEEHPVRLLGEPEARPPKKGEVIYRDRVGAICRRWNWKEADRTKLTETTTRGLLVIEGLPPVDRSMVAAAAEELAALVQKHCGGRTRVSIVDRERPETELG